MLLQSLAERGALPEVAPRQTGDAPTSAAAAAASSMPSAPASVDGPPVNVVHAARAIPLVSNSGVGSAARIASSWRWRARAFPGTAGAESSARLSSRAASRFAYSCLGRVGRTLVPGDGLVRTARPLLVAGDWPAGRHQDRGRGDAAAPARPRVGRRRVAGAEGVVGDFADLVVAEVVGVGRPARGRCGGARARPVRGRKSRVRRHRPLGQDVERELTAQSSRRCRPDPGRARRAAPGSSRSLPAPSAAASGARHLAPCQPARRASTMKRGLPSVSP